MANQMASCKRTRDDTDWMDGTPDAFLLHTQFCWTSRQSKKLHTMPWDLSMKSPFQVQADALTPQPWKARMPPLPCFPGEAVSAVESEWIEDSFFRIGLKAVSSADQRLLEDKLSWERKCACKKWCSLILMKLSAWSIGRDVASGRGMQFANGGLMESVVDALAGKASSTLHNRASPLLKYAKYWRDRGQEFFPIQEGMVYTYIKSNDSWAPTAPRSLLIALSFAFHVPGLAGGDVGKRSARVKGVTESIYVDRRKLVQRPPLKVEQIQRLEKIVHDENRTNYDRVAAGYFLMLIYGRLRYSDGLRMVDLQLDTHVTEAGVAGFLEARAERTKTSVTLERKIRFLPVAIPVISLYDPSWVLKWMELREQAGLAVQPPYPMLPSPQMGGGWSRMPLAVGPAADWLRSLLQIESSAVDRVATHSCKATLLSFASKFGMDHGSRRLLGYHTPTKDKSLLTYSRDSMSGPLRKLTGMIVAIKQNQFCPDTTRSGYFPSDQVPPEASVDESKDASSSESSSSRGSDSEEDTNHEEAEALNSELVGEWSPKEMERTGRHYARHKVSRCIHAMADETGLTFVCGRAVSTRYIVLLSKPAFMHPVCNACFKN